MKLQQLEYALAIAREGSVTKAAKSLFQAQPNISMALRELEAEIGIAIFWRTPGGMILTPEGEEFLVRARSIVDGMHSLETDYLNKSENEIIFKASSVRAAYISGAFGEWVTALGESRKNFSIHFVETNTHSVVEDTAGGKCNIGFIRVPSARKEAYLEQLATKNLKATFLMEYPLRIMFSRSHPLARYKEITYDMLADYPEIVHGDEDMTLIRLNSVSPDFDASNGGRKVYIYDRGSQMSMVNTVRNSYMWIGPIPKIHYISAGLTIRNSAYTSMLTTDMAIYRKSGENSNIIKSCIECVQKYAAKTEAETNQFLSELFS